MPKDTARAESFELSPSVRDNLLEVYAAHGKLADKSATLKRMHEMILEENKDHAMAKISEAEFVRRGLSHGLMNQKKRYNKVIAEKKRKLTEETSAPGAASQ